MSLTFQRYLPAITPMIIHYYSEPALPHQPYHLFVSGTVVDPRPGKVNTSASNSVTDKTVCNMEKRYLLALCHEFCVSRYSRRRRGAIYVVLKSLCHDKSASAAATLTHPMISSGCSLHHQNTAKERVDNVINAL